MILKFETPLNLAVKGNLECKEVPGELRIGEHIEILNPLLFRGSVATVLDVEKKAILSKTVASAGGDYLLWLAVRFSLSEKVSGEYYVDELEYFNGLEGWKAIVKERVLV